MTAAAILEALETWCMIMLTALGCVLSAGVLIMAIIIIVAVAASVIKTLIHEVISRRRQERVDRID